MLVETEICFKFDIDGYTSLISFPQVSVSLPCSFCVRGLRTVNFDAETGTARCHPGSSKEPHPYLGNIAEIRNTASSIEYVIHYYFESFEDGKYDQPVNAAPAWGRAKFKLKCKCSNLTTFGTQTNLCRPFDYYCSSCGEKLCTESKEMPIMSWRIPEKKQNLDTSSSQIWI